MRTLTWRYHSLIRTIGAASTVLLKNTGGVLPLNKPRTIGIIGEHLRGGFPSARYEHTHREQTARYQIFSINVFNYDVLIVNSSYEAEI
jgi:hypothetical protein